MCYRIPYILNIIACSPILVHSYKFLNTYTHSLLSPFNCSLKFQINSLDQNFPSQADYTLNELKESLGSEYFISREDVVDGEKILVLADDKMPLLRLDSDARERIRDLDRPLPFKIGDYAYVTLGVLKHSRGTVLKVEREDIGGRFKIFMTLDCRNEKGELFKSLSKFHGKGRWFYDSALSSSPLDITKSPPLPNSTNYTKIINVEKPSQLDDARTIQEVIELADLINPCKNLIIASNVVGIGYFMDKALTPEKIPGFRDMITKSLDYIINRNNIDLHDYVYSLFAISILGLKQNNYENLDQAISKIIENLTLDNLVGLTTYELSNIIRSLYFTNNRHTRLIGDVCHLLNGMDIKIVDLVTSLFALSQLNWRDRTIVKHFEDLILKKMHEVSRGNSILLLNYLIKLNSDNTALLDALYNKSVTRDSIASTHPNLTTKKFIILFEAVCTVPHLYKKFLVETKSLLPQIISQSDFPTIKRLKSCFRKAGEKRVKYYEMFYSRGIELFDNLSFDESLDLLDSAAYIGKPDGKLLYLPIEQIPPNQIGWYLMSLSKLFPTNDMNKSDIKQFEYILTKFKKSFNTINVAETMSCEKDRYSMLKNLKNTLTSLANMKASSLSILDKSLEIIKSIKDEDNLKILSMWAKAITIFMVTRINDPLDLSTAETIRLDENLCKLDERLFDIANNLLNIDCNGSKRELITIITSSIYSMSLMGKLTSRDISIFYEFCKNNINNMDNVHLLMISDAIPKMNNSVANGWRAIFANIQKGINRINDDH